MFSINLVTFAFCETLFCRDSLKNVAGIDFLSSILTSCQTKNIQLQYSKCAHSSCYQFISEHFGENCVILLQRLQNDGALNVVQFFLDHSVDNNIQVPSSCSYNTLTICSVVLRPYKMLQHILLLVLNVRSMLCPSWGNLLDSSTTLHSIQAGSFGLQSSEWPVCIRWYVRDTLSFALL